MKTGLGCSFMVVVPAIDERRTSRLLRSMLFAAPERIILVDNTVEGLSMTRSHKGIHYAAGGNIGIAASWNIGVQAVLAAQVDYLIIVSTSVEFTDSGGFEWVEHLGKDRRGLEANGLGWHLVAIGRPVFEAIGGFDSQFFAYYEENDFLRRMLLAGLRTDDEGVGPHVDADARLEGTALHFDSPGVDYVNAGRVYQVKWGGAPGAETRVKPRWEVPR